MHGMRSRHTTGKRSVNSHIKWINRISNFYFRCYRMRSFIDCINGNVRMSINDTRHDILTR